MTNKIVTEERKLIYPRGLLMPEDFMVFLHFPLFIEGWKELGLSDDDLRALEVLLMIDPKRGQVIRGTNGLRKVRFAPRSWNSGKSGGIRVGYVHFQQESQIALMAVYAKSDKANLTAAERNQIAVLVDRVRKWLQHD